MGSQGKSFLAPFAMESHGKCGSGHSATYCLPVCHGNSSRHGLPWDLRGKPFKTRWFSALRSYMRLPWNAMANRPHPPPAPKPRPLPGSRPERKEAKERIILRIRRNFNRPKAAFRQPPSERKPPPVPCPRTLVKYTVFGPRPPKHVKNGQISMKFDG